MVGSAVSHALAASSGSKVEGTQRRNPRAPDYFDLLGMAREQYIAVLGRRSYDYIVNCIGILRSAIQEQDADSISRATRVNALFPQELPAIASGSRIIHISTDGVFSGKLARPYVESDPTDPIDTYGRTKAQGESRAANVINIRCSLIGRDPAGKGIIEWVLRSREGAELRGFEDQRWNGVTTKQFAELCRRIIASESFDQVRNESFVHHFCPNPVTTKYDLLQRVSGLSGRKVAVRRAQSGAPNTPILGSMYSSMQELYPERLSWDALITDALNE
jgi:dTDP-4-dehydrorhamnose reductase